jgi:tRNA pseudouridine-54 N-methylase
MEELPKFNRKEIDNGSMNREALILVNSIRSSLFTSFGVRKDVNVIIYPHEPKLRMIRIDGENLRYMGPDERSISILLLMSRDRLMSGELGDEVSSPGISVVDKVKGTFGVCDNALTLKESAEGSDLRKMSLTRNVTYVCSLEGERRLYDIDSYFGECSSPKIALKSAGQTDRTILMINNEIDRQIMHNVA